MIRWTSTRKTTKPYVVCLMLTRWTWALHTFDSDSTVCICSYLLIPNSVYQTHTFKLSDIDDLLTIHPPSLALTVGMMTGVD